MKFLIIIKVCCLIDWPRDLFIVIALPSLTENCLLDILNGIDKSIRGNVTIPAALFPLIISAVIQNYFKSLTINGVPLQRPLFKLIFLNKITIHSIFNFKFLTLEATKNVV